MCKNGVRNVEGPRSVITRIVGWESVNYASKPFDAYLVISLTNEHVYR